jgi:hypothetical protein
MIASFCEWRENDYVAVPEAGSAKQGPLSCQLHARHARYQFCESVKAKMPNFRIILRGFLPFAVLPATMRIP